MIAVFLQNAWSPVYAGKRWPRKRWLEALGGSVSGRRLRPLVSGLNCYYENLTPEVASKPSIALPADTEHVLNTLGHAKPTVVVACGALAERALLELWPGPLLVVPHPASRTLTNALYCYGNELLRENLKNRIKLRQGKGYFSEVSLVE